MVKGYEFEIKTNLNLSELIEKFQGMNYPMRYKMGMKKLHLQWMINGSVLNAMMYCDEKEDDNYVYDFEFETKDDFLKLHDIIHSMGMFISEYEVYVKTKDELMDIKNKIENMGYKIVMELIPEGVELHLMKGEEYINVELEVEDEDMEGKLYEFEVASKEEFIKLHDIISSMM